MEDLWSANELPREGFDDGMYTNEVMTDLDDGFNNFCNMIFNPKEELLPPVSVPASVSNHVPYYTPNQPENGMLQQPLLQVPAVPPEQDKKIQQLELTCSKLTAQVREATEQLVALRHVRQQPTPPNSANSFGGVQVDFQEALKGIELPAVERKLPIPRTLGNSSKIPVGKPRTAHNLIEKKYRLSINEKINELRLMVTPDDEGSKKLQKAGVLKKAIEYIHHLQMKNEQLIEHNKMLQKQVNYLNHKLATTTVATAAATSNTPSPQTSDTGIDSPISLDEELQTCSASNNGASPVAQPNVVDSGGLMFNVRNGGRLFSCFLLIICLFVNPFQSVSLSSSSNDVHIGRSLLQEDDLVTDVPMFYWSILWIVRLLIASVSFGGLMIWSRYKTLTQSKTAFSFWRHEKQAQLDLNEGKLLQAQHKLELCLVAVDHQLPSGSFWLGIGLLWNIFCHFLHSIYIGRWLVTIGSVLWHVKDEQLKGNKGAVTCEDVANVYHRLHKIKLSEGGFYNHLLGFYCGLNALNMYQIGSQSEKGPSVSDMYVMMVLQLVKLSLVTVRPLILYYLQCAKVSDSKKSSLLHWAWHSEGRQFLVGGAWIEDLVKERLHGRAGQPLEVITEIFCKHLLVDSYKNLLLPNKGIQVESVRQLPSHEASLHAFRYVLNLSREISLYHSSSNKDDIESIQWWSAIGIVSAYWLAGNDTAAADYYNLADSLPESLNKSNDPLPSAILLAFKAVRMHVASGKSTSLSEFMQLCETASGFLKQSVALPLTTDESIDDELTKLGQLHACDWLLGLQQILWETCDTNDPMRETIRINFQHDVESLSYLASQLPEAKRRLYLYKAVEGIMQGSNPIHIQQLLQQTNDKMGQVGELSSYEQAMAVLLSHKYLPQSFDQGNSDLSSAAKVLHSIF